MATCDSRLSDVGESECEPTIGSNAVYLFLLDQGQRQCRRRQPATCRWKTPLVRLLAAGCRFPSLSLMTCLLKELTDRHAKGLGDRRHRGRPGIGVLPLGTGNSLPVESASRSHLREAEPACLASSLQALHDWIVTNKPLGVKKILG